MGDAPISNYELARQIEHLAKDLHDDLTDIRMDLAKLMPRELYDAHRAADKAEMMRLEQRVEATEKHDVERDKRDRNRVRLFVTSLVVPTVLLLVQVLLKSKGALP